MATPTTSYQKLLIEKTKDEDTTELDSSSGVFWFREEPRGLRWQLPDAPDPEVPGREGQLWTGVGTEMSIHVPKLVSNLSYEEAYVVYDGYFMFTSDQKFLVERVEDEDVTGLTIPVQRP